MKTLIIGGGLSGLALADALAARGDDFLLLEARGRFGGRILSQQVGTGSFDLGPAWFWPGQPRIAALVDRLGLDKFDQYTDVLLTYEDERGHVQTGRGYAAMQGSWRLDGGLGALTRMLAVSLPEPRKRLNAEVKTLIRTDHGITAQLQDGTEIQGHRAVLALPPRIAAEITFHPALPDQTKESMRSIATWMAGQAKAVAIYESPFWRAAGRSGDAISRTGPMVEIHDASATQGGPYALFGFIGVPPQGRQDEQVLRQHLSAQLGRLFGPKAAEPVQLLLKDWACDPHTSTAADQEPLYAHPTYGLPDAMRGLWDDHLLFAGTEVAPEFGGYIEGALEAAENVLRLL